MSLSLPEIRVGRKGEQRVRGGHLWVFGDDLREVPAGLPPGEWVLVRSRSGELLGTGTLNLSSRISLRIVSRGAVSPTGSFVAGRIGEALRRRNEAGMGGLSALRLLYSEGDFLPGVIADRYGAVLVVLDPPSFAKSRVGWVGALRGYRDINRLGFLLAEPGGIVAASSCTQLIDMAKWMEALRDAAADAGADAQLLRRGGQPADHPVLLGMPETEYLKFAVFRKREP